MNSPAGIRVIFMPMEFMMILPVCAVSPRLDTAGRSIGGRKAARCPK